MLHTRTGKKENKKSLSGNKVCLEEEKVLLPNPIVLSQIFPRDCIRN